MSKSGLGFAMHFFYTSKLTLFFSKIGFATKLGVRSSME